VLDKLVGEKEERTTGYIPYLEGKGGQYFTSQCYLSPLDLGI